jgi:hypothetical protein
MLAVSLLAMVALAAAGAEPALASSGVRCAHSSTYGSQCIAVTGAKLQVEHVRVTIPGTGALLADEKWRIDLERYDCNPIRKPKFECPAAFTWHGLVRRRDPGDAGGPVTDGRYWLSFSMPRAFKSNVWLCAELAIYNRSARRWVYNAAGLTSGLRACVSIHR